MAVVHGVRFCTGMALIVGMVTTVSAQSELTACEQEMQRFNASQNSSDVDVIIAAFDRVSATADCAVGVQAKARIATANRVFKLAYERDSSGAPTAAVDRLLEQSESIVPTWRALSFAGTREHRAGRYDMAASKLQSALSLIADESQTPLAPPVETIASLHQLATESLLLAERFVASPVVRGEVTGVLASNTRGFSVERTSLPIRFKTASTEFTQQGLAAAQALLQAVRAEGQTVQIVGHADERGTETDNQALSEKRAHAVRDWLLEHGVGTAIQVKGAGEHMPLRLSSASDYTQEQIWQMNRRVELVRLGSIN